MGTVTSAVTVDTGEWTYVDSTGVQHKVTNAETFNLTIDDGGAADVQYRIASTQTVATDDGYVITLKPHVDGNNTSRSSSAVLTDAGQGTANRDQRGEFIMNCSSNGVDQIWHASSMNPSDADFGAAGTIAATFEDQYGNTMSWVSTMTVAQAA